MKPIDSDEEEELGAYQQKLRERANRSIQRLSSALTERSPDGSEEGVSVGDTPHSEAEADGSWTQLQQSAAVNQLKTLLQKQQRETSVPLPSSERQFPSKRVPEEGDSDLPAIQDLVPIIYNQSDYIQHLEAEVKFCKEELLGIKQRIRVVIVENEKLHSELKSKVVEESLNDPAVLVAMMNETTAAGSGRTSTSKPASSFSQQAYGHTWKNELEQLKVLYQAQTETLEAQVISLRKELSASQKECEEVKGRLRHREAQASTDAGSKGSSPRVAGLCLKCAQHEAVLAETHSNMHIQAIERLTKERDELMAVLCSVRASQAEAQQREWTAYQQVKQAVEMAEEANLEKTRAVVQCEQVSRELARQRERLEKEVAAQQERLGETRVEARAEALKEKQELTQTVGGLSQRVAELEGQVDRGDRERVTLTNQLDDALRQLTNQEQDAAKVCGELRHQASQAQLRREEMEREMRDGSARASRESEKAAQEVERLSLELVGCRQRLEAVQRDGSQSQAEALSLAEQLASAQRQLHLTRQEKESSERDRDEDVAALTFSAQQRQSDLALRLQQTEAQHEQRVGELDALLSSQNSLIRKLKEECCMLGTKLEDLAESSRDEADQLSLEKQHLEETAEKLRGRCDEMEAQCVQHGRMHQRMKNRLQQLDQHCQSSAQQVLELLAKQNQLMQERHVLTEEMQSLRIQFPRAQRADSLAL